MAPPVFKVLLFVKVLDEMVALCGTVNAAAAGSAALGGIIREGAGRDCKRSEAGDAASRARGDVTGEAGAVDRQVPTIFDTTTTAQVDIATRERAAGNREGAGIGDAAAAKLGYPC